MLTDIAYLYAINSGLLQLETIEGTAQISSSNQFAFILICAIVNIISLFFIFKNLIIHKKKLIVLNVIQLLLGTMFNLISGIVNIVLLSTKTKDVEEQVKEKKELPVLEDITKHKWYVYFIIFILLFILCYTPFTNLLPIPDTQIAAITSLILIYVIQVSALVVPMFNELKRVLLLVGDIPNNQEILLSMPLYITAFLAIVIGSLTEELMFRGFIRKFIKNDTLFLILSSLIFGGLHVLSADSLQQILFIIPYSLLGFAFSLNYVKTKNIASNIFLHSAWNTLAVILNVLTSL